MKDTASDISVTHKYLGKAGGFVMREFKHKHTQHRFVAYPHGSVTVCVRERECV